MGCVVAAGVLLAGASRPVRGLTLQFTLNQCRRRTDMMFRLLCSFTILVVAGAPASAGLTKTVVGGKIVMNRISGEMTISAGAPVPAGEGAR